MNEYLPLTIWVSLGVLGIAGLRRIRDVSLLDCILVIACAPIVVLIFLCNWAYGLTVLKRK